MKILLTGSTGFVGSRLYKAYPDAIPTPSLRHMTEDQILRIVEESEADVIIHTAAISDIPTCAANEEASYIANVLLPIYLAKASKDRKLICFSSDQVYSGLNEEGPYTEDVVKPANIYAAHKIEMENRVLDIQPDAVMLRAEWMYDYPATRPNYIYNMLTAIKNHQEVSFSKNQYRGITYLREVEESMEAVMRLPGGVYNYGSETTKSMYEITEEFLEILKVDLPIKDVPARHNLWMDCSKARRGGVMISDVMDGLRKCIEDYHLYNIVTDQKTNSTMF